MFEEKSKPRKHAKHRRRDITMQAKGPSAKYLIASIGHKTKDVGGNTIYGTSSQT